MTSPETKPGYKTTEFWLTILITLVNFLNVADIWRFVPTKYSVIGQAIITAVYALSRGQAKQGIPYETPPVMPTTTPTPQATRSR